MNGYVSEKVKRYNYLLGEIEATYHEMAAKFGLSDSEMNILYALCQYGGFCELSDITELTGIRKQTLTSALHKLERNEMIQVDRSIRNGKKKNVCLTDSGKTFVKYSVSRIIEIENEIFDSWSEEDVEMYMKFTMRYLKSLKEKSKNLGDIFE